MKKLEILNKYEYPKTVRENINGKRVYSIGEEKLPSVTTILSATQSEEKRQSLQRWIDRVGRTQADHIKNTAATRGTAMHYLIEKHILEEGYADLTDTGVEATRMANKIIESGLSQWDACYGVEVTQYYPGLYAGQSDLVGVFRGRDTIGDFKQTNKPKRREWIEDYFLQLVAYAEAHNVVYGTNIKQGMIMMCSPDCYYQEFILEGQEYQKYYWQWLKRVDEYYSKSS